MKETKKHINTQANQKKIGDKQQINPNSLKNLKPRWKSGESGNPQGRPIKNKGMIERLKEIGNEEWFDAIKEFTSTPEPMSKREKVYQKVWERANDGEIPHIKLLAEYDCL